MPNQDIKQQLQAYRPTNEQEEQDKAQMLRFIDSFTDVTTRQNTFGHFTASAFIVNHTHDKMLVVGHKIFGGYIYPGGHADGETNLLSVALREAEEESGLKPHVLSPEYYGIQSLPVAGHIKHDHYVSAHTHYDVVFLMEADEAEQLAFRPDESTDIKWISFDEADNKTIWKPVASIHRKLIKKFKSKY